MKGLKKRLIQKADELEWSVTIDGKNWEFEKFSPAGEDFIFSVSVEDVDDLWVKVWSYACDFDTEEHIEMWVEAKMNGREGIPSIRSLVEYADAIKDMIEELAETLREATEEEE